MIWQVSGPAPLVLGPLPSWWVPEPLPPTLVLLERVRAALYRSLEDERSPCR